MNPEQTSVMILKLFRAAWPTMELDEYTPHVWAEGVGGLDPETCLTAAKRLTRSEEWPPSIARFRAEVENLSRGRQRYALPTGQPVDRAAGVRASKAIQEAFAVYLEHAPAHRHHDGVGRCPNCSTQERRQREMVPVMRQIIDAALRDEEAP